MKVSTLIKEIVDLAESKFGVSPDHINDNISIGLLPPHIDAGGWQVWLIRPTQRQLDVGQIDRCETVKVEENKLGFYTEAFSLMSALNALKDAVSLAESW